MDDSIPTDKAALAAKKALVQAELDKLEKDGSSCPTCLYTGVATCLGLAAYFTHAAYEPAPPKASSHHRPVFLAVAAGWLCLGAYRWHLG